MIREIAFCPLSKSLVFWGDSAVLETLQSHRECAFFMKGVNGDFKLTKSAKKKKKMKRKFPAPACITRENGIYLLWHRLLREKLSVKSVFEW